jgi:hypothetical protein
MRGGSRLSIGQELTNPSGVGRSTLSPINGVMGRVAMAATRIAVPTSGRRAASFKKQQFGLLPCPARIGAPFRIIIEKPLHPPQKHARRFPLSPLPLGQRAGVNANALGGRHPHALFPRAFRRDDAALRKTVAFGSNCTAQTHGWIIPGPEP